MPTTIFSQNQPAVSVTFHAVGAIRTSARSTATAHPVEEGVDVTDHIQQQADQVFVSDAVVSDSPYIYQLPNTPEFVTSSLERMRALGLVTLVTSVGTYRNMAITSLDWDKTSRGARIFNLSLQRIRLAAPVTVLIPARQPPPRGEPGFPDEHDAGVQAPVEPTAPVNQSLLSTFTSFLWGSGE